MVICKPDLNREALTSAYVHVAFCAITGIPGTIAYLVPSHLWVKHRDDNRAEGHEGDVTSDREPPREAVPKEHL